MRLRQLVIAAESLDTADVLQAVLGLGAPFADDNVTQFGLVNAVFALGDQFLEVVVPVADSAPARRFIDRGGEGGYMVIFDTDDIDAVRKRADAAGVRRVLDLDFDDITASHLHPADMGAAIVSVDQPHVPGEWPWGGPDWKSNTINAGLAGAVVESGAAGEIAGRWGSILGINPVGLEQGTSLPLEDAGVIEFTSGETDRPTTFRIRHPEPATVLERARKKNLPTDANSFTIAGVRLELVGA